MKKAIDKILKNFVFGNLKINGYTIDEYVTPAEGVKKYEVEIFIPGGSSINEVESLVERLENAFTLLGFKSTYCNFFYVDEKDNLLVRIEGEIKI